MPARKSTPTGSRSGSHIPNSLRLTERVEIRCAPELAAFVRQVAEESGMTLGQILYEGASEVSRRRAKAMRLRSNTDG